MPRSVFILITIIRGFLKNLGFLRPQADSFEAILVRWLDQMMRGKKGTPLEDILTSAAKPIDLNNELIIACMYLLTRLSRKQYASDAGYRKGMDEFHKQAYQWFVKGADQDIGHAEPFEKMLRTRYVEYDAAFSRNDNPGIHHFSKAFLAAAKDSLKADGLPLATCAMAFSSFVEAGDAALKEARERYPELRKSRG